MSKERLEGIKNGLRSNIQDAWPDWEDIEWLAKQAEEKQELERKIHLYELRKENAQELNEVVIKPLQQQNNRYREALEEITTRKMSTFLTTRDMSIHFIKIARKALEE